MTQTRLRFALLASVALVCGQANAQEIDAKEVFSSVPLLPTSPTIKSLNPMIDLRYSAPLDLGQIPTEDVFASVGRGYDPIRGKILSVPCVDKTENDWELGSGTMHRVFFNQVNDVKSHQQASGSSVGFSAMIKSVSIGFGSSEARGEYFNSVDQYGRIYSRVVTKAVERRNVKWSKDASEWIRNDISKFLTQCGTRFVRGVYSGHLLDMTARFKLQEDQKAVANASALSIGVAKVFSASGSVSEAEKSVDLISDASLTSTGVGAFSLPSAPGAAPATPTPGGANAGASAGAGTGAPAPAPAPATTPASEVPTPAPAPAPTPQSAKGPIETLIDYYNYGFRAAVAASPKESALPLYIIVEDYHGTNNLELTSRIPRFAEQMIETVLSHSANFDDLTTAISNLSVCPRTYCVFVVDCG